MAADKLKFCRLNNRPISPKTQLEQEKRIRREIANSNERRRMQSINAGFQSLRTLLPHHDGEKLSKAAILQHTADYIYQLEQEKTRLLAQNCQLKRLVNSQLGHDSDQSSDNCPLPKRAKIEKVLTNGGESSDSSDEGVACSSPKSVTTGMVETEPSIDDLRREMVELRVQLDRERRLRMSLEEQTRALESQLYPERIREIAQNVQMQFQHNKIGDVTSHESSDLVTSDEVIAETIEIETHSCPGSPQESLSPNHSFVFQTPVTTVKSAGGNNNNNNNNINSNLVNSNNNNNSNNTTTTTNNNLKVETQQPQDLSSKTLSPTCPNKKSTNKSLTQPAAIALPIDVPFIATDATTTTDVTSPTVTVEILASGSKATTTSTYTTPGSTSRQNLDTIVEAIRHLEGDHLFRDDDTAAIVVKEEDLDPEELISSDKVSSSNSSTLSPALRTVLTMSPEQFGAIRHQVIQLQRPGVIVANHA